MKKAQVSGAKRYQVAGKQLLKEEELCCQMQSQRECLWKFQLVDLWSWLQALFSSQRISALVSEV